MTFAAACALVAEAPASPSAASVAVPSTPPPRLHDHDHVTAGDFSVETSPNPKLRPWENDLTACDSLMTLQRCSPHMTMTEYFAPLPSYECLLEGICSRPPQR